MTTREEFALAFAQTGYRTVFEKLEKLSDDDGKRVVRNDWSQIKATVIKEALEMADLLIDELAKEKAPPVKPTS